MRRFAAPLALLLASTACTTMETAPVPAAAAADRMVSPILTSPEAVDTLTHAQPQVARVTHVALDLDLDFEDKRVGGTAELSVLAAPGAEEIVLDTNGLEIAQVTDGQGRALSHTVGETVAEGGKGAPLTIRLDGAETVRIAYRAPADASALQWLSPEQTKGGVHPFLFSQGPVSYTHLTLPTILRV